MLFLNQHLKRKTDFLSIDLKKGNVVFEAFFAERTKLFFLCTSLYFFWGFKVFLFTMDSKGEAL